VTNNGGIHLRPARSIFGNALNFCRSANRSRTFVDHG
jgi:hypothetical protein